jgi:hypothetical protein
MAKMDEWRADADQEKRAQQRREDRERTRRIKAQAQAAALADERIAAVVAGVLESERELTAEAVGMALAQFRDQLMDYIDEQVGLLRADTTIARAYDKAEVIDLPAFLQKRGTG